MSNLTRSPRTARAAAVALLAATAVGVAACGGDDSNDGATGAAPGAAASYIPATAPVYVELSTDLDGPQWTKVTALAKKFPAFPDLQKQITEGLNSEGVDFQKDVAPLLGDDAALGVLEIPADAVDDAVAGTVAPPKVDDPSIVVALQIVEGKEADVLALITKDSVEGGTVSGVKYYKEKGSDDTFTAVTDGMLLAASSVKHLQASLDAHAAGGDKTIAGNDKATATLAKLPPEVFAQIYVDLGAAIRSGGQSSEQIEQLTQLGLSPDVAFGASLSAEANGLRMKGVVTGAGAEAIAASTEFTPALTANVPGDALGYIGFANLSGSVARTFEALKKTNPDMTKQLEAVTGQLPLLLGGVTLDDLSALTSKEHAIVVTKGGAYPAASLLLQVDDAARAQKTLDAVKNAVPLVAGQIGGGAEIPPFQPFTQAGVAGQELPLSPKANIVYAVKDDHAVIGTQRASVGLLNPAATNLAADAGYVAATTGMPEKVTGVAWLDVAGIVETADALGAFKKGDADAAKAKANLAPVKSLAAWSYNDGDVQSFEALLTVK